MKINIHKKNITNIKKFLGSASKLKIVAIYAIFASLIATLYFLIHQDIVAYGDAESHLNIAKRVITNLTPGMAQLGGIWLPLPHLLMVPFVYFDILWRTGLAGSITSGAAFVVTAIFLYKLIFLVTKNNISSLVGTAIFIINPNMLYLQSTPLTEMTLIMFFIISTYFFVKYIYDEDDTFSLILASFFGFCATLSRYDGWFLVLFEAGVVFLISIVRKHSWHTTEGKVILFSTLAFLGIALWLLWDFLILGDPLYFTHSEFSAASQQYSWLIKHELPAYHNMLLSFLYYFVTSMSNIGVIIFGIMLVGTIVFFRNTPKQFSFFIFLVLLAPFIFNVVTLFLGQSVIFIPDLTPVGFEWRLFNVRYGSLMIPTAGFFFGYLFYKSTIKAKVLLLSLILVQLGLYIIGYSRVITLADGLNGLSADKLPDAQQWMNQHYDGGLVLMDDFARTLSIVHSNIPIQNVIYVGNKPYWQESLKEPQKYARWVVFQKNDAIWKSIYADQQERAILFTYFVKEYTSPNILIFRRNDKRFEISYSYTKK